MPRRKPATWSAGERAENRARAEAKKPIAPVNTNADALLANPGIKDWQAAATTRLVHRMAQGDDDRAELLAMLLGET